MVPWLYFPALPDGFQRRPQTWPDDFQARATPVYDLSHRCYLIRRHSAAQAGSANTLRCYHLPFPH